jgi:hypothetical protein
MLVVRSFTNPNVSYTVDPVRKTCTCPSFWFQRLPMEDRTCKHLRSRVPDQEVPRAPSLVTYPKKSVKDTYFQLVHREIPASLPANTYVYSLKYDGIRIRVTGHRGVTRGGLSIELTQLALPFVNTATEYDAELIHVRTPGHNHVMSALSANQIHELSVRVFDIIDTRRTFEARHAQLLERVPAPYRVVHTPLRDRAHLSEVVREVLAAGEEGVVVRSLGGRYAPGRRDRHNVFKLKRKLVYKIERGSSALD